MNQKAKINVIGALVAVAVILSVGTISYHYLENWTWTQSLYFSVTTMTTVGYGDIIPTTDVSRLFSIFYMLVSVATGFAALGIIGLSLIKKEDKIIEKRSWRF